LASKNAVSFQETMKREFRDKVEKPHCELKAILYQQSNQSRDLELDILSTVVLLYALGSNDYNESSFLFFKLHKRLTLCATCHVEIKPAIFY
jgi:hypothetical protein